MIRTDSTDVMNKVMIVLTPMNVKYELWESICGYYVGESCTYADIMNKSCVQDLTMVIWIPRLFTMVLAHSNECHNGYLIPSNNTNDITKV